MRAEVRRSRLLAKIVARGIIGLAGLDALLFGVAGRINCFGTTPIYWKSG
jgi:hypothetical protein